RLERREDVPSRIAHDAVERVLPQEPVLLHVGRWRRAPGPIAVARRRAVGTREPRRQLELSPIGRDAVEERERRVTTHPRHGFDGHPPRQREWSLMVL